MGPSPRKALKHRVLTDQQDDDLPARFQKVMACRFAILGLSPTSNLHPISSYSRRKVHSSKGLARWRGWQMCTQMASKGSFNRNSAKLYNRSLDLSAVYFYSSGIQLHIHQQRQESPHRLPQDVGLGRLEAYRITRNQLERLMASP